MGDFFQQLSDSPLGLAVRESPVLFPWIESIHVLALTLVVGSIAIVDLRLLGLASRSRSITKLMKDVLPYTWGAFAVALATGLALFVSQAPQYVENVFLQIKLVLLLLIGVNVLIFHVITTKSIAAWDAAPVAPPIARIAGATSLVLWAGVVVAGRWIGFA